MCLDKKIIQSVKEDLKLIVVNQKALVYLTMYLDKKITQSVKECNTTKDLWDALVEKIEGNLDMRESRKEMLNGEFNMFNDIQGESIESIIDSFEALNTNMRSVGIICEVGEINKKLLNSIPYTWNGNVTT
ncbi:uncharacterized protein LOC143536452 [Bidens hawaiensis]|uniref:uncharacterized protein LOC143536452 n=1 Tax=Bidens hawaiensis TaxID=980011 RepID=UPI00404A6893